MKTENRQMKSRRGGQTLIGVLVVLAIIVAAAGFYFSARGKNPDGSESSKTALGRSVDLAKEIELQSNIGQIQQIIGMYKNDNEGKVPASLEELQSYAKFPAEMWINPVDKKPLGYNPQTGAIIVTPYEGMSPAIARMTANPMQGAADAGSTPGQSTPVAPGAPTMPNIPTIPNSGAAPPMDDMQ
jgi:type II secretory pathway pseudopilin PulG